MYSKIILPIIKWHEFCFFGGISEWPERAYGSDFADHYQRRQTRSPLVRYTLDAQYKDDTGPSSYSVEISGKGEIIISSSRSEG